MIKHHEGAIDMVGMIENSSDQKIKQFGEQITVSQTGEIEAMQQLIKSIG